MKLQVARICFSLFGFEMELLIFLPLPQQKWDHRHASSCLFLECWELDSGLRVFYQLNFMPAPGFFFLMQKMTNVTLESQCTFQTGSSIPLSNCHNAPSEIYSFLRTGFTI